jgi:hypothetical protein
MSAPTHAVPVLDPVAFLLGTWSIDRDVHDALSGQDGTYEGTATFAPDGDGLAWTERGTLRLGDHVGRTHRDMVVVPGRGPDAGPWEVLFGDGRPFHPLDLATGACRVDHPCGEDHYAGGIRVERPGLFVVSWRVVGPRKDHTIVSRYSR